VGNHQLGRSGFMRQRYLLTGFLLLAAAVAACASPSPAVEPTDTPVLETTEAPTLEAVDTPALEAMDTPAPAQEEITSAAPTLIYFHATW
jgi:hypothetical protein